MNKTIERSSLVVSFGLFLLGLSVGIGFYLSKRGDHYVTVRGLAERNVTADQATWQIEFESRGSDPTAATQKNAKDRKTILDFLSLGGFSPDEVRSGMPRVNRESAYKQSGFIVRDSLQVTSSDVLKVEKMAGNSGALLQAGVALAGWQNPKYFFSALATIKPQMIQLATQDARKGAEQFANDSGSRVGSIRRATQGYFSFRGENSGMAESEQIRKIARVVVTIEYLIR